MNRPVVALVIYFILGTIGGVMGTRTYWLLLFVVGGVTLLLCELNKLSFLGMSICILFFCMGMYRGNTHPIVREQDYFKVGEIVEVSGKVYRKESTAYTTKIYLQEISLVESGKKLKSKLIVETPIDFEVEEGNWIFAAVEVKQTPLQMNPSDFSVESYYKQNGILKNTKLITLKDIKKEYILSLALKTNLHNRVSVLFGEGSLVQSLLLGIKESSQDDLLERYYRLGIGHLFSLSGFHIGILLTISLYLLGKMGAHYTTRHIAAGFVIWGYALITGAHLSTLRACIMATVWILGRCLWEEEDEWSALFLTAGILLFYNPYQLYGVSFVLSFGAVAGILVGKEIVGKMEENRNPLLRYKWFEKVFITLFVSLVLNPITAYYFYEIPFIGTLLNLIMIPIFSVIIPLSMGVIAMSYVSMGLATRMGEIILLWMDMINEVIAWMYKMPFMSLCIGRMSLWDLGMYVLFIVSAVLLLHKKTKQACALLMMGAIILTASAFMGNSLEVTNLYVAQGDAAVLFTPDKKAIVVDGGPFGKGKTIKRFLNYNGYDKIDVALISHDHEDHIGGIIDLIHLGIPIKTVVVGSVLNKESLRAQLEDLCVDRGINIVEMTQGDRLQAGEVAIEIVWPKETRLISDNEASLVCTVTYKKFTGLFTGDTTQAEEIKFSPYVGDIDYVKIAHHGSSTSTSEMFLEYTSPRWAVISCGIQNRYHHPHESVVSRLQDYDIENYSTHQKGAISIKTNGDKVVIKTMLK